MTRKEYEWEKYYYGERTIKCLEELKNILNGIESVSDLVRKIYQIEAKYEDLTKWCIVTKYLAELKFYYKEEKEEQNDD